MKSKRPPGANRRFLRRRSALLGAVFLLLIFLTAILGPHLWRVSPWYRVGMPLTAPGEGAEFPLCTALLGRDVLGGVLYGAQVGRLGGIAAALATLPNGAAVGAIGGF